MYLCRNKFLKHWKYLFLEEISNAVFEVLPYFWKVTFHSRRGRISKWLNTRLLVISVLSFLKKCCFFCANSWTPWSCRNELPLKSQTSLDATQFSLHFPHFLSPSSFYFHFPPFLFTLSLRWWITYSMLITCAKKYKMITSFTD